MEEMILLRNYFTQLCQHFDDHRLPSSGNECCVLYPLNGNCNLGSHQLKTLYALLQWGHGDRYGNN